MVQQRELYVALPGRRHRCFFWLGAHLAPGCVYILLGRLAASAFASLSSFSLSGWPANQWLASTEYLVRQPPKRERPQG